MQEAGSIDCECHSLGDLALCQTVDESFTVQPLVNTRNATKYCHKFTHAHTTMNYRLYGNRQV